MHRVIRAYLRGYRVTREGDVIGLKGDKIKAFLNSKSKHSRLSFNYKSGGKKYNCHVHKLQAFQKYGLKALESGVQVRHMDKGPYDNSWDNILIGTQSDNMMDRSSEERLAHAKHASSFAQVHDHDAIKNFHFNNGNSYKRTMEEFNITSKGSLNYILNKK